MKLNKKQMEFVINSDVEEMVKMLEDDYELSTIAAFDKIYNSQTYQKLLNERTGLYLESPRYIYTYLKEELEK